MSDDILDQVKKGRLDVENLTNEQRSILNKQLTIISKRGLFTDVDNLIFVKNNNGMLINMAKKFQMQYRSQYKFDLEDLKNVGYIGLKRALEKYDVNHPSSAQFNTFAYYWVFAEMRKYVITAISPIHVPE